MGCARLPCGQRGPHQTLWTQPNCSVHSFVPCNVHTQGLWKCEKPSCSFGVGRVFGWAQRPFKSALDSSPAHRGLPGHHHMHRHRRQTPFVPTAPPAVAPHRRCAPLARRWDLLTPDPPVSSCQTSAHPPTP